MLEELKQMNEELEALKNAHLEKSKAIFTKITAQLFEKHPRLESFMWTQYTPYFNDGDSCEFGVNTDFAMNGCDSYDEPLYEQIREDKAGFDKEIKAAYDDVEALLETLEEEVLEQMFGDHKMITVTAEGVEVEEYDHD